MIARHVCGIGDTAGADRSVSAARRNLLVHLLHANQPFAVAQVYTRR